jgi:hypothetical protein
MFTPRTRNMPETGIIGAGYWRVDARPEMESDRGRILVVEGDTNLGGRSSYSSPQTAAPLSLRDRRPRRVFGKHTPP